MEKAQIKHYKGMRYKMKNNKYGYIRVLQQRTEMGWEDTCAYPSDSSFYCDKNVRKMIQEDLIAYRTNQSEYEYRVIGRRVLCGE